MYNHQISQKALGHLSPTQALKNWQQKEPERFKKQVYNLSGSDRFTNDFINRAGQILKKHENFSFV
jgi:hypothetical protein